MYKRQTYNRSTQKVVYTIIDDTAKKTLEDNVLLDTGPSGASLNKTQEDLQKIADGYGTVSYTHLDVYKRQDQNNGTLLTYTNSSPNDALITFNVSYKFGLYPYGSNSNYNNYQFAPGNTDLKVIVEAPSAHLEGTIHVNNPETMDFVADVKNNARPDNTFTADGKSIYTFTMEIVHDPADVYKRQAWPWHSGNLDRSICLRWCQDRNG